jgi:hypothetical protein
MARRNFDGASFYPAGRPVFRWSDHTVGFGRQVRKVLGYLALAGSRSDMCRTVFSAACPRLATERSSSVSVRLSGGIRLCIWPAPPLILLGISSRTLPSELLAKAAPHPPQAPEASGIRRAVSGLGRSSCMLPHSGQTIHCSFSWAYLCSRLLSRNCSPLPLPGGAASAALRSRRALLIAQLSIDEGRILHKSRSACGRWVPSSLLEVGAEQELLRLGKTRAVAPRQDKSCCA